MSNVFAAGSPVRKWLPWLVMFVVVVAVLSVAMFGSSYTPTPADRVAEISRTVKCPTCAGESVAESNAPASQEIRRQINERVSQGQSDEEIRTYFAAKYGQDIILIPPSTGVNELVWILPVIAVAVALAVLVIVFRRWTGEPELEATDEDRAAVEAALVQFESDPHGEGQSR